MLNMDDIAGTVNRTFDYYVNSQAIFLEDSSDAKNYYDECCYEFAIIVANHIEKKSDLTIKDLFTEAYKKVDEIVIRYNNRHNTNESVVPEN